MKISLKNKLALLSLFLLLLCFLTNAPKTAAFAYIGLNVWYENMISSLFPFMVITNLLILSGLSGAFIRPASVLLKPLFRLRDDAVFVLFFGFLCGFPLGAKCVVDLYQRERLTFAEAEYLLCFTNNIGPAYFLGFVLGHIYPSDSLALSLFFMYGIPLLYGLLLRYSLYRRALNQVFHCPLETEASSGFSCRENRSLLKNLVPSVQNTCNQMVLLGGYMICFNALRVLPEAFLVRLPLLQAFLQGILELSGGLLCIKAGRAGGFFSLLLSHALLSFGGLCCFFQTQGLLENTPLSAQKYMLHKIILCSITVLTILLVRATLP